MSAEVSNSLTSSLKNGFNVFKVACLPQSKTSQSRMSYANHNYMISHDSVGPEFGPSSAWRRGLGFSPSGDLSPPDPPTTAPVHCPRPEAPPSLSVEIRLPSTALMADPRSPAGSFFQHVEPLVRRTRMPPCAGSFHTLETFSDALRAPASRTRTRSDVLRKTTLY